MSSPKTVDVLFVHGGWITPGTNDYLRKLQSDDYLEFLARKTGPATKHFMLVHCGWWLDADASASVRNLTAHNPEPHRRLRPCDRITLAKLRAYFQRGRLEFIVYPYAACVAEATSGEGLLRSLRLSRDLAREHLGAATRAVCSHDRLNCAQLPQIARLLGFSLILGGHGWLCAPDGTCVRQIGPSISARTLLEFGAPGAGPFVLDFELHNYLSFAEELQRRASPAYSLVNFELRATSLDEFLRRAKSNRRFDARKVGTKNWYGGVTDSLLLEQNAKQIELRLPAIEATSVLAGTWNDFVGARLTDLWKKSFILMDNHILWQCHNYKSHFLPESFRALEQMHALEAKVLGAGARAARNVVVFNPTPWTRDIVLPAGPRTLAARNVPGWGARVISRSNFAPPRADSDALTLSNDIVTYSLNASGEVIRARAAEQVHRFEGLGRLVRIHERPVREVIHLRTGQILENIEGAFAATATVDLKGLQALEVHFEMDELEGEAFLLQAERIAPNGKVIDTAWQALHSLHWGGAGMPRHRMAIAPRKFSAWGARKMRFTLWMLAEGQVMLGPARVWTHQHDDRRVEIPGWRVEVKYRLACTQPKRVESRVIRCDAAMKTVRFSGILPDLRYVLDVSLRRGCPTLEYALNLHFPRPTRLGVLTPPFSEADGSLLGAQCERPYLPGLVVLLPLPQAADYYSDQTFFLRKAFVPSALTWHTDRQNWWLGMSTFIGMNLAVADFGKAQLGLLTRGIKHFFRWRRGGSELLGLSLGATVIHQMTQGHSAPPDSQFYPLIKRTSHNPYFETPFLRAHGEYLFHYALCLARPGEAGRRALWRRAQEFALPSLPLPVSASASATIEGIQCEPEAVVPTALEPRGEQLALRVLNMSSRSRSARVRLPIPVRLARRFPDRARIRAEGNTLLIELPPWALREIILEREKA